MPPSQGKSIRALFLQGIRGDRIEPLDDCCEIVRCQPETMKDFDVIVIGGGMAGLAAAIRLAQFGKKVALIEQQEHLGGLNTFYVREGRIIETGLHALTNYPANEDAKSPFRRILRQLRISESSIPLAPQLGSLILWGDRQAEFGNDWPIFAEALGRLDHTNSSRIEDFLKSGLLPYERILEDPLGRQSARTVLSQWFTLPERDLLLLPVMAFGSPTEEDLSFGQFSMIFRAMFLEGLCRPVGGIAEILNVLQTRLKDEGGHLRLGCRVCEIRFASGRVEEVVLSNGETLSAEVVISTAGWPETWQLFEHTSPQHTGKDPGLPPPGQISFVEVIAFLDQAPKSLGLTHSLVFYAQGEGVTFRRPTGLLEPGLGVICIPENFQYPTGQAGSMPRVVRLTCLGNYREWAKLSLAEYTTEKHRAAQSMFQAAARLGWDIRSAVVDYEVTTPLTIARYTGRCEGAVYGSPEKLWSGRTMLENLWVAGTDQGFVGVVGALLGGVLVANQILREHNW